MLKYFTQAKYLTSELRLHFQPISYNANEASNVRLLAPRLLSVCGGVQCLQFILCKHRLKYISTA